MGEFFSLNWRELFVPSLPLLEIILRGTLMYLGMFLIFRLILKREAGVIGTADLLMVVLIADAAQNGMTSNYKSVTEGLILVSTIVGWNYLLDLLGSRISWIKQLLEPPPLQLIREGKMILGNMRREFVTEEDLLRHLREQGVEEVREVKSAFMESDGQISVIPYDPRKQQGVQTSRNKSGPA